MTSDVSKSYIVFSGYPESRLFGYASGLDARNVGKMRHRNGVEHDLGFLLCFSVYRLPHEGVFTR